MAVNVYYGQSTTAAGETQKVVVLYGETVIPEFSEGDLVTVYFKEGNTATNPTLTFERNDTQAQTTSNSAGHPIKIRGAEPQGNSNEFIAIDAWEAGETKQFVYTPYIYNPDRAGADTGAYWEMLDGGNATTLLYGDTKFLHKDDAQSWLDGDVLDDEDEMAISSAMIRELLKPKQVPGEEPKESIVTLNWTQETPTGELGTDYLKLGDLSISTAQNDPKFFYVTKQALINLLDLDEQKWIDRTAQLDNNGHSDTIETENDNLPITVKGYGERGPKRYYIENYETTPVEFTDNFTALGDVILGTAGQTDPEVSSKSVKMNGPTTVNNTLAAGATTVASLNSSGLINGAGAIRAYGNIESTNYSLISAGDIYEKTEALKNRYSGKLKTVLIQRTTGPIEAKGHTHNQSISIPANAFGGNAFNFLGIVGYNLNEIDNNNKAHNCYVWEIFPNLTEKTVFVGVRNTGTEITNGVQIQVWVLLEKVVS